MSETTSFTFDQAIAAQRALRSTLGLGEERFPAPAFVGMISDEIQRMREARRSDADIVAIIAGAIGQTLSVEDLARFYASPERRHPG